MAILIAWTVIDVLMHRLLLGAMYEENPALWRSFAQLNVVLIYIVGAVAFGAFAIGALPIARLAIRRLAVNRVKLKSVEIEELIVTRIQASEIR